MLDIPARIKGVGYRRNIEHGLRFWEAADVGVRIDEPADLPEAVRIALVDPPGVRANREAALDIVYAYRDGRAAGRATAALLDWASQSRRWRHEPRVDARQHRHHRAPRRAPNETGEEEETYPQSGWTEGVAAAVQDKAPSNLALPDVDGPVVINAAIYTEYRTDVGHRDRVRQTDVVAGAALSRHLD